MWISTLRSSKGLEALPFSEAWSEIVYRRGASAGAIVPPAHRIDLCSQQRERQRMLCYPSLFKLELVRRSGHGFKTPAGTVLRRDLKTTHRCGRWRSATAAGSSEACHPDIQTQRAARAGNKLSAIHDDNREGHPQPVALIAPDASLQCPPSSRPSPSIRSRYSGLEPTSWDRAERARAASADLPRLSS